MTLAPKNRSICDWTLVWGMAAVLAASTFALGKSGKTQAARAPIAAPAKPAAVKPAPASAADPRNFLAVYRQPVKLAETWAGRGANVVVGYEKEQDAAGNATVSQQAWRSAYAAVGIKYVCEPTDLAADDRDPNLLGILYPVDEPDNKVVEAQDTGGNREQVYLDLENFYKRCKQLAPHKPVVINLGLEQLPWRKVDYARLLAACDWAFCDWYPIHRGRPISAYGDMIDLLDHVAGNEKLVLAFIECSDQHLDPTYYPQERCPTADEFRGEWLLVRDRKLSVGLFPQQIGQDGKVYFLWDAMPPDLVNVTHELMLPAAPPASTPNAVPDTLIINGFTFRKAA
jgi:hypothetical protein